MIKPDFPNEDLKKDAQVMAFYHHFEDPTLFESDLCRKCGGKCCKRNGCAYAIEDFAEITKKGIMQKLEHEASIRATFEISNYGATPVLFLESRGKGKGPVNLFSLPTSCALLTDQGCLYKIEDRPTGGILLLPKEDEKHELCCEIDEHAQAILLKGWLKYQKLLNKLVKYYTGNTVDKQLSLDILAVIQVIGKKLESNLSLTEQEKTCIEPLPYFREPLLDDCLANDARRLKLCLKYSLQNR
mgnify:CR=1 FL=1